MKAHTKFKTTNGAGQLASIEGHAVPTSFPRRRVALFLFFKGEVMKTYYTLLKFDRHIAKWIIVFGDYDRETVEEELEDCKANYGSSVEAEFHFKPIYKIITTSDAQADIKAKVAGLKKPSDELARF